MGRRISGGAIRMDAWGSDPLTWPSAAHGRPCSCERGRQRPGKDILEAFLERRHPSPSEGKGPRPQVRFLPPPAAALPLGSSPIFREITGDG